jgi:transcriptional regulator with XRE-family HTH domain
MFYDAVSQRLPHMYFAQSPAVRPTILPGRKGRMQNRISILRTQRGLSLSALAELVGTTKAQIQKLERGDRRLSLVWMQRIARALNVKVSDLLPPEADDADASGPDAAILSLNSSIV